MKIWKVTYEGLWMGGIAIVRAETSEEAIELTQEKAVAFTEVSAEEIPEDQVVIYQYNGEY
jgi:hypothetical protein